MSQQKTHGLTHFYMLSKINAQLQAFAIDDIHSKPVVT